MSNEDNFVATFIKEAQKYSSIYIEWKKLLHNHFKSSSIDNGEFKHEKPSTNPAMYGYKVLTEDCMVAIQHMYSSGLYAILKFVEEHEYQEIR